MIDIKLLREDPEVVRASQRARGEDAGLVDLVLAADEARRSSLAEFEAVRAQQKAFGKQVAAAKGQDKAALVAQAKETAERVKSLEAAATGAGEQFDTLAGRIGNVILDGVPAGGEDDFVVRETVGTARDFAAEGVAVRDHVDLGTALGLIDLERGARVSGSRFYYLRGWGTRLANALMTLCQQVAHDEGFTPLTVPNLVRAETMGGTGYLDKHDDVYYLPADELYLTGTSEVGLAGFHAGEILDLSGGPLRYTATSTCYRREAGSHGKDTRGIFRVHQFTKTEMFVFCTAEQAAAEHANLLRIERRVLDLLELPYRIIDVAAGDLGGSAARKFDCEAWVPSQERFRELTSTSNCTTFQARRLGIRERLPDEQGGGTRPVATLNGTMLTDTRPIVALLENHQQADGSIRVPAALAGLLGTDTIR